MRTFLILGGLNAFLAVALGAFGAHALRSQLTTEMLEVYKTGVNYHLAHALGLILIGLVLERRQGNVWLIRSGWLIATGILLFSGSLYALSISGTRILGAITPFGGLCFLSGWLLFVASLVRE